MNPKLLIYSDAGQSTGFEKITRNLVKHLSSSYEITVAGIGYFGQVKYDDIKVIPATLNPARDFLGLNHLNKILREEKPDVILIVQDVWNAMPLSMTIKKYSNIPIILYTMPDSPNVKWIYGLSLTLYDAVICPTEFAIRELCASIQAATSKINIDPNTKHDYLVLNDKTENALGVRVDRLWKYQSTSQFDLIRVGQTPIPAGYSEFDKKYFMIPSGRRVILNVNTNSFRKRQDLSLVAFSRHLKENPHDVLVLHCQGGQEGGWDIKQLISLLGIEASVIYSTKILSEAELFGLYSCADLMINTSSGEGWGLPAVEGFSLGINQLVPNWSATQELWNEDSRIHTVPNGFHYSNVNTMHGRIYIPDLVYKLSNQDEARLLITIPSWDIVSAQFDSVINRVLNSQTTPTELSMNEVIEGRTLVQSYAVKLIEDL